jgi:archaellum component FlaC
MSPVRNGYQDFVLREDFEKRLSDVNERFTRLEGNLDKQYDQINNKIDRLQDSIRQMQIDIQGNITSKWQWIAGTTISFFIGGGGIYGILSLLHGLK